MCVQNPEHKEFHIGGGDSGGPLVTNFNGKYLQTGHCKIDIDK